MPNIFHHKVTPSEIEEIDKMTAGRQIDKKNRYEKSTDDDLNNADLFRLYTISGEKQKAKLFFSKIKDNTLKYFLEH